MASGLKIINGDFSIGFDGIVKLVEGNEKCLRDFGKMLQTSAQSDDDLSEYYRYNPNYGSLLDKLITHNMSKSTILEVANSLMYVTIRNYLDLQETRDNLSAEEIILDINFEIYFDVQDPTLLRIPIKLTNSKGITYSVGEFEQRFI